MNNDLFAQKVAQINKLVAENKGVTHIYLKRVGLDGMTIDQPIDRAIENLRNHPEWEVVSSNKSMDDEIEELFKDDLPLPEKEGQDWPEFPPTTIKEPIPENVEVASHPEFETASPQPKRRGRPVTNKKKQ